MIKDWQKALEKNSIPAGNFNAPFSRLLLNLTLGESLWVSLPKNTLYQTCITSQKCTFACTYISCIYTRAHKEGAWSMYTLKHSIGNSILDNVLCMTSKQQTFGGIHLYAFWSFHIFLRTDKWYLFISKLCV